MKQQYKSGAVAAAPPVPAAPSVGNPTEGDVANGVAATVIGAHPFYQLFKELEAVIADGGLAPDAEVLTQVRDALRAKYVAKDDAAQGGVTGATDARAAAYTVAAADDGKTIEVNANAAPRTITLPDLDGDADGFTVTVMKVDSSANQVVVDGHGADTINGAATLELKDQYEAAILKWTGTAWLAIGGASTSWLRNFFPPRPAAPTGAVSDPFGIRWNWADPGGATIDHEVQMRKQGEAWPMEAAVGLANPARRFGGVTFGETYEARARARGAGGASNWGPAGSFVAAAGSGRIYALVTPNQAALRVFDLAGNRQKSL